MPTITHLYRYPIKGLSAEVLETAELRVGEPIAFDRCFALTRSTTVFDPQAPQHLPKTHFLMLMKDARLAALHTVYDHQILYIYQKGKLVLQADLRQMDDRQTVEAFFADYLSDTLEDKPRLVEAPGHMFSDVNAKVLSCINLASLRSLENTLGTLVHPLRFRANVYFEGAEPWDELTWVGRTLQLGTAKVRVVKPIERCAAIHVNPATGERDLPILSELRRTYHHRYMGIYVEVINAGKVSIDNLLTILS